MSAKTTKNVIFPLFFTGETPPVAILSGAVEKRRNRSAPTGAPPLTKGTVHIPFIIGKKRGKVKYSGEGAPRREPIFSDKEAGPLLPFPRPWGNRRPCPSGRRSGRRLAAVSVCPSLLWVPTGPFCKSRPSSALSPLPKAQRSRPRRLFDRPLDSRTDGVSIPAKRPLWPQWRRPAVAGDQRAPSFCPPYPCGVRRKHAARGCGPSFAAPLYKKEQTPIRHLLLGRGEITSPPSSLFRRPFAPAAFPARRCGSPGRGWRWRSPALPAAGRWGRCGCWRHRGPCRRGRWRPPGSV